jgi:hypothetical protein
MTPEQERELLNILEELEGRSEVDCSPGLMVLLIAIVALAGGLIRLLIRLIG